MIDELNQAVDGYKTKWQTLVDKRTNKAFFEKQLPTSVAYKTVDLADYDKRFNELRDLCDQIFVVWLNDRWIAKMHLKDSKLTWGIQIIKLMQRRPGSTDATGLDHIDFYSPDDAVITSTLKNELDVKWTIEQNNPFSRWNSVWFDGTEAKLRDHTIEDVCIRELEDTNKKIKGK